MRPEDYLFVNLHSLSHPATHCITCRIVLRGRNLSDTAHYVRESGVRHLTSPQIERKSKISRTKRTNSLCACMCFEKSKHQRIAVKHITSSLSTAHMYAAAPGRRKFCTTPRRVYPRTSVPRGTSEYEELSANYTITSGNRPVPRSFML